MDPGQHLDGSTGIHRDDERRGEVPAEVRLPAGDQLRLDPARFRHDIADIGKAFGAQHSSATYWGAMQIPEIR